MSAGCLRTSWRPVGRHSGSRDAAASRSSYCHLRRLQTPGAKPPSARSDCFPRSPGPARPPPSKRPWPPAYPPFPEAVEVARPLARREQPARLLETACRHLPRDEMDRTRRSSPSPKETSLFGEICNFFRSDSGPRRSRRRSLRGWCPAHEGWVTTANRRADGERDGIRPINPLVNPRSIDGSSRSHRILEAVQAIGSADCGATRSIRCRPSPPGRCVHGNGRRRPFSLVAASIAWRSGTLPTSIPGRSRGRFEARRFGWLARW